MELALGIFKKTRFLFALIAAAAAGVGIAMNNDKAILHAYMAGGKALWLQFLRKANFILLQRNNFYLTIMVVVKH